MNSFISCRGNWMFQYQSCHKCHRCLQLSWITCPDIDEWIVILVSSFHLQLCYAWHVHILHHDYDTGSGRWEKAISVYQFLNSTMNSGHLRYGFEETYLCSLGTRFSTAVMQILQRRRERTPTSTSVQNHTIKMKFQLFHFSYRIFIPAITFRLPFFTFYSLMLHDASNYVIKRRRDVSSFEWDSLVKWLDSVLFVVFASSEFSASLHCGIGFIGFKYSQETVSCVACWVWEGKGLTARRELYQFIPLSLVLSSKVKVHLLFFSKFLI